MHRSRAVQPATRVSSYMSTDDGDLAGRRPTTAAPARRGRPAPRRRGRARRRTARRSVDRRLTHWHPARLAAWRRRSGGAQHDGTAGGRASAPDFALKNQHGQTVRLSQFRGQSGGRRRVLSVGVQRRLRRRAARAAEAPRRVPERRRRAAHDLDATRCTRCGPTPTGKASRSRCCRTSGHTVRSRRRTASSSRTSASPCAARSSSTRRGVAALDGDQRDPRRPRPRRLPIGPRGALTE